MTLTYGSVCSGIEAASVAWGPLGWTPAWFAEIEKFPSAVLAERFGSNMPGGRPAQNAPPNYGDFTRIGKDFDVDPIDLLVGGTPCQSFSIAGKRAGLDDPRGNLTLEYAALARRLRPRWFVWENVPGVLSDDDGRTFGQILALFAGHPDGHFFARPRDGWRSGGIVEPAPGAAGQQGYGLAWRVLDAQYFGVPQRRRRVFAVGYLGDWRPAAAVLFEPEGLRGDPAPRRKTGQGVAATLAASTGGISEKDGIDGRVIDCSPGGPTGTLQANGKAAGSATQQDAESGMLIAHSLRGEGFDASEDGTGRGTPLVPVAMPEDIAGPLSANGGTDRKHGFGMGQQDWENGYAVPVALHENQRGEITVNDTVGALKSGGGKPGQGYPAIAFSCKDLAAEAGEIAPTLRAMGHGDSHANAGGQVAVACDITNGLAGGELAGTIEHAQHKSNRGQGVIAGMAVRRLTPRECERLQGFPDDWTQIPWRGKAAGLCPDGPRYKGCGNSKAVPVVGWIGARIDLFEREVAPALAMRAAAE